MRRRDFLKSMAAAIGVYYRSPFTPGHKADIHEVMNRNIVEFLRVAEYGLLWGVVA